MNAWGVQTHMEHSAPDYAICRLYVAAKSLSTSCCLCVVSISGDCAADVTSPLRAEYAVCFARCVGH